MNSAQVRVMARRIWNTTIASQPLNKRRIAYRKWMLKGHPNKGGNEIVFKEMHDMARKAGYFNH